MIMVKFSKDQGTFLSKDCHNTFKDHLLFNDRIRFLRLTNLFDDLGEAFLR